MPFQEPMDPTSYLCVGGRTRSTAVNAIMDVGELVCYTIGLDSTQIQLSKVTRSCWRMHDITARRRPTVRPDNDAILELDGHDGSSEIDLS